MADTVHITGMIFMVLIGEDLSTWSLVCGGGPFILCDLLRPALLVAFPAIATWLPSTM